MTLFGRWVGLRRRVGLRWNIESDFWNIFGDVWDSCFGFFGVVVFESKVDRDEEEEEDDDDTNDDAEDDVETETED